MPDTTRRLLDHAIAALDEPDTQRPDIRLDRETWDGRLAVETITRRGIEAFAHPNGPSRFDAFAAGYRAGWCGSAASELPKPQHDRCLREFIAAEGLVVEGGDCE